MVRKFANGILFSDTESKSKLMIKINFSKMNIFRVVNIGDRNLLWAADMNQTSRVRATVCRDHDNVPVTTLVSRRMRKWRRMREQDNRVS